MLGATVGVEWDRGEGQEGPQGQGGELGELSLHLLHLHHARELVRVDTSVSRAWGWHFAALHPAQWWVNHYHHLRQTAPIWLHPQDLLLVGWVVHPWV
jgi:hypothetical protein